jgi:GDPmannose 4,6-dehydratase
LSIKILDFEGPDDFVVATGEGHTVRELVSRAFELVGLDWKTHVRVDSSLVRPSEPTPIVGNTAKLRRKLGAVPRITFDNILRILLAADLRLFGCEVPFASADDSRAPNVVGFRT